MLSVPPEPNHVTAANSDSYEPSSDPEQSYEFDCRPELAVRQTNHMNELCAQPEPDYVNISAQVFSGTAPLPLLLPLNHVLYCRMGTVGTGLISGLFTLNDGHR